MEVKIERKEGEGGERRNVKWERKGRRGRGRGEEEEGKEGR